MGRIRVRSGESEIELDSRDLHIDNQTAGRIIAEVSGYLRPSMRALDALPEAEAAEPEFGQARAGADLAPRLDSLEAAGFFSRARTVADTVEQLREEGRAASPLDVSRALAKMAMSRRLSRGAGGYASCRFAAPRQS